MSRVRPLVLAPAVLLLAVLPGTAVGPTAGAALTSITLVSEGNDGAAATEDSGQAALSADGNHTAFDSAAVLRVHAAVPQTPAEGTPHHQRVYVRDRLTRTTTLASDAGAGDATAPTISGGGRLVAYAAKDSRAGENQIDVVDRQATGRGSLDGPGNLVRTEVTGNLDDPRYQRLGDCPAADPGRCGPSLSADGSTLAYPARLSPVSPGLRVSALIDDEPQPLTANLVDFVPAGTMGAFGGANFGVQDEIVDYTNTTGGTIRFTAPPATTGPFEIVEDTCGSRLAPGDTCTVDVRFDVFATCPDSGTAVVETGELTTRATTPAGQTGVALVATCAPFTFQTSFPAVAAARAATSAAAEPECPAPPTGLPLAAAQPVGSSEADDAGTVVVDTAEVEVGRPELVWTTISGSGTFNVLSPDCSLRLVDPTTLHPVSPLPVDQPPPCRQGEQLGFTESAIADVPACTAYLLVDPAREATTEALVDLDSGEHADFYMAVTGMRHVIVARHGPGFATSAGTVVSVDGHGVPVPGASEPTLSTTGRFVAFTDGTAVWRHDTVGRGTVLASCLPGAGACRPATAASLPAISGDGSRIVFAGRPNPTAPDQVYVREIDAGRTLAVAPGSAPAISQDGSTVAFSAGPAVLLFDLGPGTRGSVPVARTGRPVLRPSLDAHGRLVAFDTSGALLPGVPSGVDTTYLFERTGRLAFAPTSVAYGRVIAGVGDQTRTVTVTNTGVGPITVTGLRLTGPFRVVTQTCAGGLLRRGQRCTVTVLFRPVRAGRPTGELTWTTADNGEPPALAGVPVTATVVVPAVPLLTVSPTVAYAGQVVRVTGTAFPAGVVTLRWEVGLGSRSVVAGLDGTFAADVVIFPDDRLGRRSLLAVGPTGTVLASAPVLAAASPAEPPFHRR